VLAIHCVAYAQSVPLMDYGRRFAFHGLGYLSAIALVAVSVGIHAVRSLRGAPAWGAAIVLLLAAGASVSRGFARVWKEHADAAVYERTARALYYPASAWVLAHTDDAATIAVYPDAGLVPYVTRRRAIDFGRLNDRALARARSPREVADTFFAHDPDLLLVSSPQPGVLFDEGAAAIVDDPRFAAHYSEAQRYELGPASLLLYARTR
jgi:hypothetical protein